MRREAWPLSRVLFSTDIPFLQTDVVRKVENILKEHNAYGATFWEIGEHTPIAGIRNGVKAYKENGCDHIIAVGGGSPIDGSKAILYNIQLEDGKATPPQIAIPTTLSAAEYSVSCPSSYHLGYL